MLGADYSFLGGVLILVIVGAWARALLSPDHHFPVPLGAEPLFNPCHQSLPLGWTLVGWVVALAMAVRDVPDHSQVADSPREVGTVEDLNQLADLHERGLLTDEEFAAAKRRTLTE